MQSDIKCPNCGHEFDIENVLSAELEQKYQKEFQEKLNSSLQNIEEEKKRLAEEQKQFEEREKEKLEDTNEKLFVLLRKILYMKKLNTILYHNTRQHL